MSSFTKFDGELNIEYATYASKVLKDDYWVLKKKFIYYLEKENSNKFVLVPEGFLSDGASVPRPFRGLIPKMGAYSQAAFLHDYLCETYSISLQLNNHTVVEMPITRKKVDEIFFEAMKVANIPLWKRKLIEAAVSSYRLFANPKKPVKNKKKKELEVKYSEGLM